MKPTISLRPIFHKNGEQIGIYFKNNLPLNIIIRKNADGIWSQTKKCWYVPLNRKAFDKLKIALNEYAILDTALLKRYLEEKNSPAKKATSSRSKHIISEKETVKAAAGISNLNKHVIPEMVKHLQLKGYSASTIKTYTSEIAVFLKTIKDHTADEFSTKRLKDYLSYCAATLKLTENTLHSRINALKFYYEQVLKRPRFFGKFPGQKSRFNYLKF